MAILIDEESVMVMANLVDGIVEEFGNRRIGEDETVATDL